VPVFEEIFEMLDARNQFRPAIAEKAKNAKGQAAKCAKCRQSLNGNPHI